MLTIFHREHVIKTFAQTPVDISPGGALDIYSQSRFLIDFAARSFGGEMRMLFGQMRCIRDLLQSTQHVPAKVLLSLPPFICSVFMCSLLFLSANLCFVRFVGQDQSSFLSHFPQRRVTQALENSNERNDPFGCKCRPKRLKRAKERTRLRARGEDLTVEFPASPNTRARTQPCPTSFPPVLKDQRMFRSESGYSHHFSCKNT